MSEIKKMEVKLIEVSGMESVRIATGEPYQTNSKNMDKIAYGVWKKGHRSITRHSIISFKVDNVSQSLLRQLSRHPHINLTVKSSRYCDMSDVGVTLPDNINKLNEVDIMKNEYENDMTVIMDTYKKWKAFEDDKGKKLDIAKQFLPLGSQTSLVVSGNIQAIYEMIELRMCVRAESEYHKMAVLMRNILANHDEYIINKIFSKLGCKGDALGYCTEGSLGCGKFDKKEEY